MMAYLGFGVGVPKYFINTGGDVADLLNVSTITTSGRVKFSLLVSTNLNSFWRKLFSPEIMAV